MTQALFLASRSAGVGQRTINGVQAVVINLVSTANAATVIAAAVAKCNADGESDDFDANYFDTVATLSDLSGGPLNGNNLGHDLRRRRCARGVRLNLV